MTRLFGPAMRWIAALSAVMCLFAGSSAFAQDTQPGDDFLKLVDTRKYGESWDASSDYMKQSVSRAEWATSLTKARDTIGTLASRTLKSSVPQKDPPGAPPGEYLIVTYDSVFASQGAPKTETLPLIKGSDGRWRAIGYFIR